MSGGSHGALVKPGKPGASMLIDYLTGVRDRMPKGSDPLPDPQITLFRRWIIEGATDDSTGAVQPPSNGNNDPTLPTAKGKKGKKGNGLNAPATFTPRATGSQLKLLESYNGHLAANDTSFKLRLMQNGTATADWVTSITESARYEGTYTGTGGTYIVVLKVTSGSGPNRTTSLVLSMRPSTTGAGAMGTFGMDTTRPKLQISELALAELGDAPTNPKTGGGGTSMQNNGRKRGK